MAINIRPMNIMNTSVTVTPIIMLVQIEKAAMLLALSLSPAPKAREIQDIPPAMKIIPVAINMKNTGTDNETAAICNGSLVCAMKNVSAKLYISVIN